MGAGILRKSPEVSNVRTRIESANISADLLPRVERFAELLDAKLDVFQSFQIEAVLSAAPMHLPRSVLLRMGVRDDAGAMRWDHERCLTPDNLEVPDLTVQRLASHIVYQFIDHLLVVSGDNLRRRLQELRDREPVTVGA